MSKKSSRVHEAYPLSWPVGRPRTLADGRAPDRFKVTLAVARNELLQELKAIGAEDVVVSTNMPPLRNGNFSAGAPEPADPGVAVYFTRGNQPYTFASDHYDRVLGNVRAIGLTLESLRRIERYGSLEMMNQAFRGFAALPPAGLFKPWWQTLGLDRAAATGDVIRRAHRELAALHHPDRGGSSERMAEINAARDAGLAEVGS